MKDTKTEVIDTRIYDYVRIRYDGDEARAYVPVPPPLHRPWIGFGVLHWPASESGEVEAVYEDLDVFRRRTHLIPRYLAVAIARLIVDAYGRMTREQRLERLSQLAGRRVASTYDLTREEAARVKSRLLKMVSHAYVAA
ncbi:MAG: hypothetical protein KatS3mg051_1593 [Anaerolineae bacterium]|nr:MAG: hypothetical protein KatS3mg051_1593 [Anaerolineae bacterium]